jgi:hypothetical protein
VENKYKNDGLLFNVLYSLASKQDVKAVELLLKYLKDIDRRGFAAEALGRLKEKRAIGIIVEVLRDSLMFSPELITYRDASDHKTLSSYVYMIEALKLIGEAETGVLKILEDYSTKVGDKEIRRESKEALDSLCPGLNYMVHLNYDLNVAEELSNEPVKKMTEKEIKPREKKSTQKINNVKVTSLKKLSQEELLLEKEFLIKSSKERNQNSFKKRRETAVYKHFRRF